MTSNPENKANPEKLLAELEQLIKNKENILDKLQKQGTASDTKLELLDKEIDLLLIVHKVLEDYLNQYQIYDEASGTFIQSTVKSIFETDSEVTGVNLLVFRTKKEINNKMATAKIIYGTTSNN